MCCGYASCRPILTTAEDDSDVLPLFKISVSDYVKYFNVATSVASRDVKAGVNALGESTVTFYPKEGEFEEVKRPWLAEAGMKRGRGSGRLNLTTRSCHSLSA